MSRTEEIPRNRWIDFLDELTREHQGDPVVVEVFDSEIGAQTQARDMPLQGISADVRPAGEHDVSIIMGNEPNPPLTHMVPQARHVRVERSDGGNAESVEIEAGDGSRTLLRFQLPRAA
jgi:hypothetical protein